MNDYSTESIGIIHNMADIQFPLPPDWQSIYFIVSAIILILVLITADHWRKKRRPTVSTLIDHSVLAQLSRLEQDLRNNLISPRDCAYHLASLLRQGLNLQQLNIETPLPTQEDPQQWQQMMLYLDQCRYPKNSPRQFNHLLFEEIRILLSKGPAQKIMQQHHAIV